MRGEWSQIKLSECRRVVLFSLDAETQEVEMRHYLINASPVGLTRTVKKIIKAKIPDLNRFEDISDFVLGYERDAPVKCVCMRACVCASRRGLVVLPHS
jgi:hypothetical protein